MVVERRKCGRCAGLRGCRAESRDLAEGQSIDKKVESTFYCMVPKGAEVKQDCLGKNNSSGESPQALRILVTVSTYLQGLGSGSVIVQDFNSAL